MARPVKEGLDYFPLYVDIFEDEKIEAVSGEFGIKGEIIIIKLLCAIYKKGYFILWNDLIIAQMLKRLPGISKDLLNNVVERLVLWEFFDKDLFHSAGILTSEKIQENFFEATQRRKSPKPTLYVLDKFLNHDNLIESDVKGVNVDINTQAKGVNVDINTQRKGKESKEKERREIYSINSLLPKFTMLLSSKPNTLILSQMQEKWDLKKIYDEVSKSAWLQENLDLSKASDSFLTKIVSGYYRNFKKNKNKNSYNPTTEKYSNTELEEIGKAKTDKLLEEMDNGR